MGTTITVNSDLLINNRLGDLWWVGREDLSCSFLQRSVMIKEEKGSTLGDEIEPSLSMEKGIKGRF